jgi:hypothetical protein
MLVTLAITTIILPLLTIILIPRRKYGTDIVVLYSPRNKHDI